MHIGIHRIFMIFEEPQYRIFYNMQICGEHKDSGILRFGYFASPFLPKGDITENELEATERSEGCDL